MTLYINSLTQNFASSVILVHYKKQNWFHVYYSRLALWMSPSSAVFVVFSRLNTAIVCQPGDKFVYIWFIANILIQLGQVQKHKKYFSFLSTLKIKFNIKLCFIRFSFASRVIVILLPVEAIPVTLMCLFVLNLAYFKVVTQTNII